MKTFLLYLRGGDKIKSIAKSITIKIKKRKALYSSIYMPKASIILLDENNSDILKL